MNTDFNQHIVIDHGSYCIKSGFNGENAPRSIVPSIVGKLKNDYLNFYYDKDISYIGEEINFNASNLNFKYPLENPAFMDTDLMEEIWNYIFNDELKVSPEAHNVMIVESSFSNNKVREKVAEIMFEKFNIFNLHMEPQSALALWSTAKTSGIIVESDHLTTQVMPVYDKHILTKSLKYNEIAGKAITSQFEHEIIRKLPKNCRLNNIFYTASKIKEKYAEFLIDTKDKNMEIEDLTYTLPDGNVLKIGKERYEIPEMIFSPQNFNIDSPPLHLMILKALMDSDIHIRKDLVSNIILSGGNTMIKGYAEALKINLEKVLGKEYEDCVKIICPKDRKYSVWMGASVVCSVGNFQHIWMTKNEFEEIGPSVFHKNFAI